MNVENTKVIFIGAGPANIFASLELLARNFNSDDIVIIEQGKSSFDRECPLDSNGCSECSYCDIIYGFGGAGMFSDGKLEVERKKKFDSYSANKVFEHMIQHGLDMISQEEKDIISSQLFNTENALSESGLKIETDFISQHIGTEEIINITKRMETYLIESNVKIFFNEEVFKVELNQSTKKYMVQTIKHDKEIQTYQSDVVVVGIGKSSHYKFEKLFKNIKVSGAEKPPIVGIRFEFPVDTMDVITKGVLKDPLISINTEFGDELTTYCTCDRGMVVPYYTGELLLLGGHARRSGASTVSNFGLAFIANSQKLEQSKKYSYAYAKLVNSVGGNKPVIQTYGDFVNNTTNDMNGVHRTSLKSYVYGNLNYLFPKIFADIIQQLINSLAHLDSRFADSANILSAPVIEFVSPAFKLDEYFESEQTNLFFSGETSGRAYGIVTAGASGIIIADAIINKRLT